MTELRVGLLGLGTVNGAVAARLRDHESMITERCGRRVVIAGVAVRDAAKVRGLNVGDAVISTDADALVTATTIDVVIEAIGGLEPARGLIATALQSGKHVITANKAVMADHGEALCEIAVRHGVTLRHSAAVGGGVPMLELLDGALRGESITTIEAICNGTTNFILGKMEHESARFDAALAEAQQLGFAEADPSSDVDGWDAAYKLALLAAHAWGGRVDPVTVRRAGIRGIEPVDLQRAAELQCAVKLLARASGNGAIVALSVQPTLLVRGEHPLATIDGSANGMLVRSDLAGPTLVTGIGAGGEPTAGAVVNDLVGVARQGSAGWRPLDGKPLAVMSDEDAETAEYIRVSVNAARAADEIAQMLEDRGVPVASIIDSGPAEVIVLTGAAPVAVLERARETLDSMSSVDRVAAHLEMSRHI